MYENNRKHYRVAKREIYEDPFEGVYVTKEEQANFFIFVVSLIGVSFLTLFLMILKKR